MSNTNENLSFWDHLDELRFVSLKILAAASLFAILAFIFKDEVYAFLLAPKNSDFVTYRLLSLASDSLLGYNIALDDFSIKLINTGLAGQFMLHMSSSMYIGLLSVLPYALYLIFRFISPALYENERRIGFRIISSSYLMFMLGVAITYFLIFPLTFRFLGTYQVSLEIENTITIQSYLDTFMMLSMAMGVVFEIPILCWLLSRFDLINAGMMRQFRRHVIVGILLISAIITPTTDLVTLFLVALPMYLLYELSILIVKKAK